MSYTRQYPGGVPALQLITPGNFEYWDISISTAIDGTGGGTYSGPIILTNTGLTGVSYVSTDGDVSAANITATVSLNSDGTLFVTGVAAFGADVEVSGILTVLDALLVTGGTNRIETDRIIVNRVLCASPGTQTIDTSSAAVLALNFIADDTWEITLNNGAAPAQPAILATVATLVDTNGTAHLQLKPGSKCSVTFRAGAAQTGGIGLAPGVFPASFHGLTVADLVGPRSGAATGTGGEQDWMRLELENIGTAATPKYACKMTMGSG